MRTLAIRTGFTPPSGFSAATKAIAKGFPIEPPDLCSRGFILLLQALRRRYDSYAVKPKIVLVSSMGMGKVAHGTIPFALRLMYTMLLEHPHADKIAMEVALSKALLPSEESYPRFFPAPSEISPKVTTLASIDAAISPFIAPQDVCVVRPALLNNKTAKGRGSYRIIQEGTGQEESSGKGMFSISRKDVGGFIAGLLGGNDDVQKWWGCQPVLAY
ncbi:uncharacterized protein EI90DRAFT_2230454 [Cantharellus anzutake]|uniref:uncharacterized protein n=1 Tax=Cantharellus anzutake TaxID=1750568 RepID=UPI00190687B9|nr:uncharacterized protein EI90DRAFT_2230454 [Cantharellus anzutake]KAF8324770.1 hypothetical protein EI90DRAFT_2230454 [Cantharellus anzutake]